MLRGQQPRSVRLKNEDARDSQPRNRGWRNKPLSMMPRKGPSKNVKEKYELTTSQKRTRACGNNCLHIHNLLAKIELPFTPWCASRAMRKSRGDGQRTETPTEHAGPTRLSSLPRCICMIDCGTKREGTSVLAPPEEINL